MDSMDSLEQDHQLSSSADLFFPGDHQHHMGSPTDQAQQKDTLDGAPSGSNSLNLNPSFLNEAGGNSMGMVMAALQSLGSNTRASNPSDGEQQPAAHNEDPGAGQGQGQLREQIILEQFKLAQLKQLQEIQQQIFQQQMALLNSGTTSLDSQARDQTQRRFHGLPTPGSSTEIRPSQPIPVEFVSPMLLNFNDIDSSSIMSLDFPGQNPYPRNNAASHTPVFPSRDPVGLDMNVSSYAAVHPQFGAGGSTVTGNNFASSPPFHATSNTGGGGHARAHDHYIAHRGTASAPAHIAFGNPYHSSQNGMNMHGGINTMNMSSEPSSPLHSELDFDISPLTSPWLGAKMTGNSNGNGRIQAYGHPQNQSQTHRNQNQMHSHLNTHAGLKRAASPSTPDIDVDVVFSGASDEIGRSRKRQASISLSPNTMRPSASNSTSSSRSSRVSSSGSRSMNSTPLLRGINPNSNTRARRGSIKSNSPMTMAMTGGAGISSVTGFSSMPSPLVDSNSGSSFRGSNMNVSNGDCHTHNNSDGIPVGNGDNSNIGFGVVGDSPSPVDLSLSMPPPAAPASAFTPSTSTRGTTLPEPLVPVTPASIMNLGNSFVGLGGGLGSVSQNHNSGISAGVDGAASSSTPGASGNFPASTSAAAGGAAKPATKGAGRGAKNDKNDPGSGTGTRKSGRRGGGGAATGDSTGLKHILPATNPSPPSSSLRPSSNLNSTSVAATSSTTTIVPVKERKTSHKAAEQKRRDSLKTTFDDLRGLLPPIPLPTDGDSKSGGTAAVDDEIGFIALAKASLLPGALPPRGPPKVGEGPNKGVSKLQLLICGNEYIRVLKGRVERRDEEVERLRREVRRLRSKLIGGEAEEDSGSSGENENEGQEGCCYKDGGMLDLDRDLDAVEVLESMGTSSSGLSASMNGGGYLTGVDEDVEED
ncbi:uncharacterized protein C8R40DRAFT_772688 [Lentinula edodes]|uniref:uncharacterized protein n=1 Tax=Lentinula edodes TaxID=5353 RepID=UPI001E8CC6EA|nr:uncharacterized protein C8R40DRAFT_772688 [Lentinula edodes]KAH7878578.1 hypothetical protein C8R40DRAFT_772688 [Lentinula edodes]